MSPCLTCSAHPRVGGENHGSSKKRECDIGSSPRGRGKPQRWRGSPCGCRLIPAWAGKTHTRRWSAVEAAAHPRVGGENHFSRRPITLRRGSSPRGRGKPLEVQDAGGVPRLIPAWAGKTDSPHRRCAPPAAHPRVGGENKTNDLIGVAADGSSPRGRGKHQEPDFECLGVGLIPAWAGKTWNMLMMRSATGAHPRVGGENRSLPGPSRKSGGSSPRGRGKPRRPLLNRNRAGLIPAWAGKTTGCHPRLLLRWAHPRVGGENVFWLCQQ